MQRRKALTVKELCERYLDATDKKLILGKGNRPKKESSLYVDRGRINRHIIPLLGKRRVQSLKLADITKFMEDVAVGKSAKIEKTKKEAWKVDRQGRTWHGLQNRWTSRRHPDLRRLARAHR